MPRWGATYSYRRRYFSETLALPEHVRALEIIADHFLPLDRKRRDELAALRERFTLLPHSLDLSLGSADKLDRSRLRAIRELVAFARAPMWSDHLAFMRIGRRRIGHLAPLPLTSEALDVVVGNIRTVIATVEADFVLENPSAPFRFGGAEYDEAEFLSRICERTGCGLLLDLANLHSGAEAPELAVSRIDPHSVRLLHVAGGEFVDGRYLDSHDRPVAESTWATLEAASRRFEPQAIIVERDTYLPPFADFLMEIERARTLLGGATV